MTAREACGLQVKPNHVSTMPEFREVRMVGKGTVSLADSDVLAAMQYLLTMYTQVHTNDRCNTQAGHWINEAFVIRLWAVLTAHHVVGDQKSIDKSLPGARSVDLCRRLRQKLAHATGDIHDPGAERLDAEIRAFYELGQQESVFDGKFILSKNTVLRRMHADCHDYCTALLAQESGTREPLAGC